jgi:dTDP-4-amino-4,6-dideoxygalactose transaminase
LNGTPATTPTEIPGNKPVHHLYVIRTPQRYELQAWLKSEGIFTGIHYPIPVHLQKAMEFLGYKQGDFPVTEKVTKEILS